MKKILIPVILLGFASAAFAGNCGSCTTAAADKAATPACGCGAKSADDCKKSCGDKCDKGCSHKEAKKDDKKS